MHKKVLSCILAFATVFTALGVFSSTTALTPIAPNPEKQYVKDGLIARYDGNMNQREGHSLSATTWHDLSGNGYDFSLAGKVKSYFTDYAFVLDSEAITMNDALINTVNSDQYTVEVALGDLSKLGTNFSTFINSLGNDNFSLFIRSNVNQLELKNGASDPRPKSIGEGREYSTNHTIAATFQKGVAAKIYVDGVQVASSTSTELAGALAPIAIGSNDSAKAIRAEYRGIRFYNRALSASELATNSSFDKITFITDTSKAIPLTVGVPYPTSNIYAYFNSAACVRGNHCQIYTSSPALKIENGYITASSTGIFDLTISNNSVDTTVNIKAVVKEPTAMDHIIFADQFNGSMKNGYRVLGGGTFSTDSTHLTVNSLSHDMTRFFLPESVDFFGDYNIVVNAIFQQVTDKARWMSIMFRGNGAAAPYYQMCVRNDASADNGIEFAVRNNTDTDWSVLNKVKYENIGLERNVQLRVKTSGNSIREFIDTKLMIDTTMASGRSTGSIGFTANKSIVRFDNITVSVNCGRAPTLGYIDVAQPNTNVIGGITLTEKIESFDQLSGLSSKLFKPANVILYADSDAYVYNSTYSYPIASVADAVGKLNKCIMPTFFVRDNAAVDAIVGVLASTGFTDFFFMSSSESVLQYAKQRYPLARRVLDFTDEYKNSPILSAEILSQVRQKAHRAWASTVVLPSNCTNYNVITYLQDMVVTTWINETSSLTSKTKAFDLLSQGPYGIISDNTELVIDATNLMSSGTMLRSPLNVGHRGSPGKAADNTIEGCRIAVNDGAEVLELDIYLTSDNHIVCSHDQWTGPYYTKNYNVEAETLATLKNTMTSKIEPTTARMPTLEEIYTEFKGRSVRFFVEIKSYRPEIVGVLRDLTNRLGVEDQVSVITFERTGQIPRMRSEWPEMSVGCLIDAVAVPLGADAKGTVENVAHLVQNYGSTINPGCDYITEDYIRASNIRGITVNPWTFRDQATLDKFFINGSASVTTDYPQWISDYMSKIVVDKRNYSIKLSESHKVTATGVKYLGHTDLSGSPIVIIEGNDIVEVGDGNVLSFKAPGTVTYSVSYKQTTKSGTSYTMYSAPVTLNITGAELGDVNGDGTVNSKDIVMLKYYLNDNSVKIETYAADVNGDGIINAADADAIANMMFN